MIARASRGQAVLAVTLVLFGVACADDGTDQPSGSDADTIGAPSDIVGGDTLGGDTGGGVTDGTSDAGLLDGGAPDAGLPDADVPDAGLPDADVPDAGAPDSHVPDADAAGTIACCLDNAECANNEQCVQAAPGVAGFCVPLGSGFGGDQCYADNECFEGPDETCEDEVIPVCDGFATPTPGWCTHTDPGPGCCESDDNCGGDLCVLGSCAGHLTEGSCYTTADCEPGFVCHGAVVDHCIDEQVSLTAGQCLPDAGPCCEAQEDCPEGDVCVGPFGDNTGVCMPTPAADRCWSKEGCGEGEVCLGGQVCPCNADCGVPDALGHCAPDGLGCCTTDAHCGEGEVCVVDVSGLGTCKAEPTGGVCWTDADCPAGLACVGASTCPCGALCAVIDTPGKCQGGPVDCCTTDFDCGEGERCVGSGDVGVCKPVPKWGQCWDGNDCSPSQTCEGGTICACDADCEKPDSLGTCTGGDQGCCTGAGVCPDGMGCAALSGIGWSTCVATPDPGRCWSDADCPAGNTCHGQAFCPCNMDCDMDYEGPGVCTPPGDACTPIKAEWVLEWCDAASVVIWNGTSCQGTCPGCCECKPFCDKTFATMEACEAACVE